MEISVDAEAIPSVEATGGAVAVAVVGWTAGLLVVRRAVAAGRLGGAGLAGKRAWDLTFDHLNHIHACLTTGLAVAIMAEYMAEQPGARVHLEVANTRAIVDRVLGFDLDLDRRCGQG